MPKRHHVHSQLMGPSRDRLQCDERAGCCGGCGSWLLVPQWSVQGAARAALVMVYTHPPHPRLFQCYVSCVLADWQIYHSPLFTTPLAWAPDVAVTDSKICLFNLPRLKRH